MQWSFTSSWPAETQGQSETLGVLIIVSIILIVILQIILIAVIVDIVIRTRIYLGLVRSCPELQRFGSLCALETEVGVPENRGP